MTRKSPSACDSLSVDALVQPANQPVGTDSEHLADSEKRRHRDRAASLDLLPVPCGEAERNHVLLRIPMVFPQLLDPLT